MNKKHDEDSELLIDLLIGSLQEEGYEVLRFMDGKRYSMTNTYDALEIKRADGVYFNICIDKRTTFEHPYERGITLDSEIFDYLKQEMERVNNELR